MNWDNPYKANKTQLTRRGSQLYNKCRPTKARRTIRTLQSIPSPRWYSWYPDLGSSNRVNVFSRTCRKMRPRAMRNRSGIRTASLSIWRAWRLIGGIRIELLVNIWEKSITDKLRMKELLNGNQAVARGVYEAGALLATSYPGTPTSKTIQFTII